MFESLLKENPRKKQASSGNLGTMLKSDLAVELGLPKSLKISSRSFDAIVKTLAPNQPIDEAIECTGRTRNTLGHNLAWMAADLDAAKYELLADNIAAACVHAICRLYR